MLPWRAKWLMEWEHELGFPLVHMFLALLPKKNEPALNITHRSVD